MDRELNKKEKKYLHLIGTKIGRLSIQNISEVRSPSGSIQLFCECECGNTGLFRASKVSCAGTRSCGCLRRDTCSITGSKGTHHLTGSPEYVVWDAMRARCSNPKRPNYANYGGKGIKVCPEWENFQTFYEEMGPRPSDGHSIDRIDNSKGYCKSNCRWATAREQVHNSSVIRGKYIGVGKVKNRYTATIQFNKVVNYLGRFDTELEAAVAYDNACEDAEGWRPNKTKRS